MQSCSAEEWQETSCQFGAVGIAKAVVADTRFEVYYTHFPWNSWIDKVVAAVEVAAVVAAHPSWASYSYLSVVDGYGKDCYPLL